MDEKLRPEQDEEEVEVVDGLPVLAEVRELAPPPAPPALVPSALQTAAAAATGFVAGAATLALLHRRGARRLPGGAPPPRLPSPVAGATRRTYLVHVISRPLD